MPTLGIENTGGASVPTAYGSNGRHVKILRYRATSRPDGPNTTAVLYRESPTCSTMEPATIHRPARFAMRPMARVSGPGIGCAFSSKPAGARTNGCSPVRYSSGKM